MKHLIPFMVVLLLSGCTAHQRTLPPVSVPLDGHAIQHDTLFDGHNQLSAGQQYFAASYDGRFVHTPKWVAEPKFDSRQVRLGRQTWWLADRPTLIDNGPVVAWKIDK